MHNEDLLSNFNVFLNNEPLVGINESMRGVRQGLFSSNKRSIFYGTGLCTPTGISIGLPFDILGIIFVAERIRKTFGFAKVIHNIADTHAKSNNLFPIRDIDNLAIKIKSDLKKVLNNFGLNNFELNLASDFDKTPEYRDILKQLPDTENEYTRREIADTRWYLLKHDVKLKISWTVNTGLDLQQGNDEMLFDNKFTKLFPNSMSFLYLKPGRTFNRSRQRVSPYICLRGENRIILKERENVKNKFYSSEREWGDKYFGGARKHLESIVHAYEKLFGNVQGLPLEDKMQLIINKALAD